LRGEGIMAWRRLTDAACQFGGGVRTARWQGMSSNWRNRLGPAEKSAEQGRAYNPRNRESGRVTGPGNLPLRAKLFSGWFLKCSGFCGGMDTLLHKQPQYPWRAEPFTLAGFSSNRPRRQGFATPRQTTARP